VRFVHDGTGSPPAYEITVSDGSDTTGPAAAVISYGLTEDEPEIAETIDETVTELPVAIAETEVEEEAEEEADELPVEEEIPAVETNEEIFTDDQSSVLNDEAEESDSRSKSKNYIKKTTVQKDFWRVLLTPEVNGEDSKLDYLTIKEILALPETKGFTDELDRLRENAATEMAVSRTVVGSTIAVSSGLSVGYVVWLIRGGALLTSVLSSLPAWRMIDPLPVLAYVAGSGADEDDDESLESLVQKDVESSDIEDEDGDSLHETD